MSVKIDMDNIERRIVALQTSTGNYTGLMAGPENSVFYAEVKEGVSGLVINKFDLEKKKSTEFLKGINNIVTLGRPNSCIIQKRQQLGDCLD